MEMRWKQGGSRDRHGRGKDGHLMKKILLVVTYIREMNCMPCLGDHGVPG